jgi:thioredoxin 1
MAIAITKENFTKEIEESTLPIVMDVYASWCGPCQQMAPHFEALEKELKDSYKFVKLNVDEARDVSIKYGVTSVPTFIFIQNNQVKGKVTGYMSKNDLKARIEEHLGNL